MEEDYIIINVDLAETVFLLHGVTADGYVAAVSPSAPKLDLAVFGQLAPCLVGIEACAGANFFGRKLASNLTASDGWCHRLTSSPSVNCGKTDAAGAIDLPRSGHAVRACDY